jgi:hypothetical protein
MKTPDQRWGNKSVEKRLCIFLGLTAITVSLTGCPGGPDTYTPQPAVTPSTGWSVDCTKTQVKASINQLEPMDIVGLNDPPGPIMTNGYVWTDSSGEARLTWPRYPASEECVVFAYYKTKVNPTTGKNEEVTVVSDCAEDDWSGDCTDGSTITVGAPGNNCEVHITTESGEVQVTGTWVTVIYMHEYQLTLVLAHQHDVVVTPALDFQPDGNLQFPVPEGTFAYTVPDTYKDIVGEILNPQVFPLREGLPFDRLDPLARRLALAPRLQAVNPRLIELTVPFPIPPEIMSIREVILSGGGPELNITEVQNALQAGVDWNQWGRDVIGGEVLFHARWDTANAITPILLNQEASKVFLENVKAQLPIPLTIVVAADLPFALDPGSVQDILNVSFGESGFVVQKFLPMNAEEMDAYRANPETKDTNVVFITSR